MSISAEPVYFSGAGWGLGLLFGLYSAPTVEGTGMGVVLCPPMGSEMMRSYRALRVLAAQLADRGVAVLHLDYHGTGNSAGRDEDPDRVDAWLRSIDLAVDELRRRSGATRLGLLGVRIGGTLAAVCASKRDDIDFLILWAACRSGKAYVREMRMLRLGEGTGDAKRPAEAAGSDEEAGGFMITGQTSAALAGLDLMALPRSPARRALVIAREGMPLDQRLVKALAGYGTEVTSEQWPGFAPMMRHPHDSVAPVALFEQLGQWLAPEPGPRRPAGPAIREVTTDLREGDATVRETAFHFGGELGLFGVLTTPVEPSRRARSALLLLNTGANYHVGPNRLYTKLAREWAASGFDVMRMDFSGIGQSELRPGETANAPYTIHGIADLKCGMAELRRRSRAERFVVIGLCSGAYLAFHAALEGAQFDGQILINTPFFYKIGDPLDETPGKTFDELQRYKTSAVSWTKWRKFLSGQIHYRVVAQLMVRRGRDLGMGLARRMARASGVWKPADDLDSKLRTATARSADTLFIYADGDAGYDFLHRQAPSEIKRLLKREGFGMKTIPGADHTFSDRAAQAKLAVMLTAHLMRVHR